MLDLQNEMLLDKTPVLGFAGYSGAGKTTLLEQVIPQLKHAGLRVGLLKHSHHNVEPDKAGKDSYRLRHAGSDQLLLATSQRHILFFEYPDSDAREPSLAECLSQLDHRRLDIILVEGFRDDFLAKIEVHRPSYGKPFLCESDSQIVAIATDGRLKNMERAIHILDLNSPSDVATFVLTWMDTAPDEEKYRPYHLS